MKWGSLLLGGALSAAVLAAGIAFGGGGASAAGRAQARPNVLVIQTDDQARATLSKRTMPSTLDLIAGHGTTFSNYIATTPLCCPSRATLITGQYGHNNGVVRNTYEIMHGKGNTLPVWLHRAGYRTIHLGKYLNEYFKSGRRPLTAIAPGWDEWQALIDTGRYYEYRLAINGEIVRYGKEPEDHLTRVLNAKAAHQIRRFAPRDKPFYLQLNHYAPHTGRRDPTERCELAPIPEPRDSHRFRRVPLPRPPSFNEADVSDKPSAIRALPPLDHGDIAGIKQRYRCGLRALRSVDRGVRKLVETLREVGELNDTVIIVVADNGYFYGEHRLPSGKTTPYEESLRLPLLIRVPPRLLGGDPSPHLVNRPVANLDLAPTILGFAHGTPCRAPSRCRVMDGRTLKPLLKGRLGSWPSDRALLVEFHGGSGAPPGHRGGSSRCRRYEGVRVPGRILIRHATRINPSSGLCEAGVEWEHYDLGDDPFQLQNIYPAPPPTADGQAEAMLRALLDELEDCKGIDGRDPAPGPGRSYCG